LGPGVLNIDKFEIALIAINRPLRQRELQDWKVTIKNLMPLPALPRAIPIRPLMGFDAQTVIDFLTSKIEDCSTPQAPSNIIKAFHEPTLKHSGTIHCEAALASLAKFADTMTDLQSNNFGEIIKVWFSLH